MFLTSVYRISMSLSNNNAAEACNALCEAATARVEELAQYEHILVELESDDEDILTAPIMPTFVDANCPECIQKITNFTTVLEVRKLHDDC